MGTTQKEGSVADLIPDPALLRKPFPRVAQRRRGLQSFGMPFQQLP